MGKLTAAQVISALRYYRNLRGMRQIDVGTAIGTSAAAVSTIERGVVEPTCSTIYAFSRALNVSVGTLMATAKTLDVETSLGELSFAARAKIVREKRIALGLTGIVLARELGIPQSRYSTVERGKMVTKGTISTLRRIEQLLAKYETGNH